MTTKARRIDLAPSEFVAGVAGLLTIEEYAVYSLLCMLIYERNGPVHDDHKWLARLFADGTDPRTIRAAIEGLVRKLKIERTGSELMVNRCRTEIERTLNRMRTAHENGLNGGRPSKKNNNITKPGGFPSKKLSTTTTTTTITNNQLREEGNGGSEFSLTAPPLDEPKIVMAWWNDFAKRHGLPQVSKLNGDRRSHVNARIREVGSDGIGSALMKAEASAFLTGKIKSKGEHENWRFDFDYFISERGFTRIIEGKYDDRPNANGANGHAFDPEQAQWEVRVKHFAEKKSWSASWGPDPLDPKCQAARSVLQKWKPQLDAMRPQ